MGAYAPATHADALVDEDWPTTGITGSSYSVHKAAVEQLLDQLEYDHPDLTVTRLRPSLIFQRNAASEIARYFLGPFVPLRFLRWKRVPLVPFPAGFRFQAVHSDDVARAYGTAIKKPVNGAYNIAAPPVLSGQHVADLLHGKFVPIPPPIARAGAALSWWARLQPAEPGWVSLAARAPLLDCGRANRELGWMSTRTAIECLAELLDGFSAHAGTASPPLRPREPFRRRFHPPGGEFR